MNKNENGAAAAPKPKLRHRILKSGLPTVIGFISTLVAVCMTFLTVFFFRPDWLLNERSLSYVPGLAKRYSVTFNWGDAQLDATKPSLWTHRLAWRFQSLCVEMPSQAIAVCADDFAGQIDLDWNFADFPRVVHLGELGTWSLRSANLSVGPFPETSEPSTFDIDRIELPWILERARIEPSTFAFDSIVVHTTAGSVRGRIKAVLQQSVASAGSVRGFGRLLSLTIDAPEALSSPLCWQAEKPLKFFRLTSPTNNRQGKGQCISQFSARVALGIRDGFLRIAELGPIAVAADTLELDLSPRTEGSSDSNVTPPYRRGYTKAGAAIPDFLSSSALTNVNVAIRKSFLRTVIDGKEWKFGGSFKVAASPSDTSTGGNIGEVDLYAEIRDLCFANPYAEGCVDELAVGAKIAPPDANTPLRVIAINQVTADARRINVLLPESEDVDTVATGPAAPVTTSSTFDWRSIPFVDRGSANYRIHVDQFVVFPQKNGDRLSSKYSGKVRLVLEKLPTGRSEWRLDTELNIRPPPDKLPPTKGGKAKPQAPLGERLHRIAVTARVDAHERPLHGPFMGDMKAAAQFSTGEKLNFNFKGGQSLTGSLTGKLAARGGLPTGEEFTLLMTGRQRGSDGVTLAGDIHSSGVNDPIKSIIKIDGFVDPRQFRLDLSGGLAMPPGLVRVALPNVTDNVVCNEAPPPGPNVDLSLVRFQNCFLVADYADGVPTAHMNFACPLHLEMLLTSPEAEARAALTKMSVDVTTQLDAEGARDARLTNMPAWRGRLNVALVDHKIFAEQNKLDLETNFSGEFLTSQKSPADDLTWTAKGQFDAGLKSFAWLVNSLKHIPYAIPAPINTLDGSITASIRFAVDSMAQRLEVPIAISTSLTSSQQSLKMQADGRLLVEDLGTDVAKPSLDAKVLLQDIALQLPDISLREKFPMLFPDSRIDPGICPPEAPKDETSFAYHIAIDTQSDKPVRIGSNLTDDVIPIAVRSMVIGNTGVQGKFSVESFGFQVFRRKARLKSFVVTLPPNDDPAVVAGNIEVKYTDITIYILISGTTEEPIISFESNPVASERDIITALLYGQDVASVDDDQLQAADDLSAAFADRMIGLASLYLLATTPVESIRYNPATKTFNAKVRLDDSTSLNVGTTSESDQRFGVRRRLTNTWAVETNLAKEDTTGDTSGTALLEWSKRF